MNYKLHFMTMFYSNFNQTITGNSRLSKEWRVSQVR